MTYVVCVNFWDKLKYVILKAVLHTPSVVHTHNCAYIDSYHIQFILVESILQRREVLITLVLIKTSTILYPPSFSKDGAEI